MAIYRGPWFQPNFTSRPIKASTWSCGLCLTRILSVLGQAPTLMWTGGTRGGLGEPSSCEWLRFPGGICFLGFQNVRKELESNLGGETPLKKLPHLYKGSFLVKTPTNKKLMVCRSFLHFRFLGDMRSRWWTAWWLQVCRMPLRHQAS